MNYDFLPNNVLIDEEDAKRVSDYRWRLIRQDGGKKRVTGYPIGDRNWGDIYLHRFILGLEGNEKDINGRKLVVDHINGNPLDNRKSNLRLCNETVNHLNRDKRKDNIYDKGVTFDKRPERHKQWVARIQVNGISKHLGSFYTAREAGKAYREAEQNLWSNYKLTGELS